MKAQDAQAIEKAIIAYANEFGAKFKAGVAAIREAGEIYAKAVREYGVEAQHTFMERYPGVAHRTWLTLRNIGEGKLNPNMLLLPYTASAKFRRMPLKTQDRIFDSGANGFQVVSPVTLEPRIVPVTALSARAAEILVDEKAGRVRTVEEQRTYIAEHFRSTGCCVTDRKPYIVVGKVAIIGGVEFDAGELKGILRELEAKAK